MLSEKAILRLSLIAIILGLGGIYLAILFIEPENVPLSSINDGFSGNVISTQGRISAFRLSNTSTAFLTLEDGGRELPVIKFNSEPDEFQKGDRVIVTGEVSKYEGKIELIARQIKTK